MSTSIPDPDDFAENVPAGTDPGVGDQEAGQPGVGGLTTDQAEESFDKVNQEHFHNDVPTGNNPDNQQSEKQNKAPPAHIPQVGSPDDIKKNEGNPVSEDNFGRTTTEIDAED